MLQTALPFRTKSLLEELQTRHPFWYFTRGSNKVCKVIEVEIQTPQFAPQLPSISILLPYSPSLPEDYDLVERLDAWLKQSVQQQLNFTRWLLS